MKKVRLLEAKTKTEQEERIINVSEENRRTYNISSDGRKMRASQDMQQR